MSFFTDRDNGILAPMIRRNDVFNTVTSVFYFILLFAGFHTSHICRRLVGAPATAGGVMSEIRRVLWAVSILLAASIVHGSAAQLGTRTPDSWIATLENPNRVAALKTDEVVSRLRIRPGSIVADIGAGAGAFEGALSAAVTPAGVVYAVDIEQGLLDHIAARATRFGLTNVRVVLGRYTDPALPSRNVDTALIYDVLHHIQDREAYLKSLAGYLAPGGRIAVVDFIPGKGGHANDAEQQVTKAQADAWMAAAGLKPVEEIALFDDKWFAIYAK